MKREYIRLIGLGAAVIFGIVGLSGCGQGGSGTGAGIQHRGRRKQEHRI